MATGSKARASSTMLPLLSTFWTCRFPGEGSWSTRGSRISSTEWSLLMEPKPSEAIVANVLSNPIGVPPSIDRSAITSSLDCDCGKARLNPSELIESGSGAFGREGIEPDEEKGMMPVLELIAVDMLLALSKGTIKVLVKFDIQLMSI